MQVWDKLYMSSNISQDRNQAIARIVSGRCPGTWFVIAISQMQDGELEILPAKLIKASWFDRRIWRWLEWPEATITRLR